MARKRGRGVGDVAKYTQKGAPPPTFGQTPEDDTVTSGVTFALVSLAVFLVICFVAIRFGTQSIEQDLEARSARALAGAGFVEVDVRANGTTVALSGLYEATQDRDAAYTVVASVQGVGDVTGDIWPKDADGQANDRVVVGEPFEAAGAEGVRTICGELSPETKVEFVTATLDPDKSGTYEVEDPEGILADLSLDMTGLTVKEGVADEEWLGSTLAVLKRSVDRLAYGLIRVDAPARYAAVSGEVYDKALSDELNDEIVALGADFGFDTTPGVILLRSGPTEEEVEELQENLNEVILDQVVEFEVTSFELTDRGKALLDEVVDTLADAPDVRVLITGHTDNRGTVAENQLLSEQRANAVLVYLVAGGLERDRFDTIGFGSSQPVASNDDEDGRARNRRIEFTALLDVQEGDQ